MTKRILVCEDEDTIREFVVINLRRAGYDVVDVPNGEEALRVYEESRGEFGLALLDIMMPGIDGFTVCKRLREKDQSIGIIMLSAKSQEMDKVNGLMLGADDYVTKPFYPNELTARIRTALRHSRSGAPSQIYRALNLEINFDRRSIHLNGVQIHLTQIEYQLLTLLAENAGRVLTYTAILRHIWGPYAEENNQILRVNMANIRRKIEKNPAQPQYVFTEVGVGYRIRENENG